MAKIHTGPAAGLVSCAICAGPPGPRVVWLADLTPAERRCRRQWYAQPCGACGQALEVHQDYRHPHGLLTPETHCVGFRLTQPVAEKEEA